jgi:hypothetical protein
VPRHIWQPWAAGVGLCTVEGPGPEIALDRDLGQIVALSLLAAGSAGAGG